MTHLAAPSVRQEVGAAEVTVVEVAAAEEVGAAEVAEAGCKRGW